jgi:hypothetical protein
MHKAHACARALARESKGVDLQLRAALSDTGSLRTLRLQLTVRNGLPPQDDAAVIARDLLEVIRVLVDATGERDETDTVGLTRRVTAAMLGYLTMMLGSHAGWNPDSATAETPPPGNKREQAARKRRHRAGLKRS